uniref:Uncharacterized protein n=1 Tax=Fundulus heteroclitus TaxID=8078 RepID=A0A3Q2NZQ4_FUNHE
ASEKSVVHSWVRLRQSKTQTDARSPFLLQAFERWCRLKEAKALRSHADVAAFLLDRQDKGVSKILSAIPQITSHLLFLAVNSDEAL